MPEWHLHCLKTSQLPKEMPGHPASWSASNTAVVAEEGGRGLFHSPSKLSLSWSLTSFGFALPVLSPHRWGVGMGVRASGQCQATTWGKEFVCLVCIGFSEAKRSLLACFSLHQRIRKGEKGWALLYFRPLGWLDQCWHAWCGVLRTNMFSKKITDLSGDKPGFCSFVVGRHTIGEVDASSACVLDGMSLKSLTSTHFLPILDRRLCPSPFCLVCLFQQRLFCESCLGVMLTLYSFVAMRTYLYLVWEVSVWIHIMNSIL